MNLKADIRELKNKTNSSLRSAGHIPAILYGHGFDNQNILVSALEFGKVLLAAGESTLVDLQVADKTAVKVLIQAVQKDPVSDQVIHVDFRQVRMDEKIETEVPIEFLGVAPAVKELGGILVTALNSVHVKALPQDLVHEIKVDITSLKEIGNMLRMSDLVVPETLEVLNKPETTVILVEAPRVEEIPEEKPEDELPEGAEEKEGEGEEGDKKEKGKESDKKDGKPDEKSDDKAESDKGDKKDKKDK
jgi:large subunit ribosomal protein L25